MKARFVKFLAWALGIFGVALVGVGLSADFVGLGSQEGIGGYQLAAIIIGGTIFASGVILGSPIGYRIVSSRQLRLSNILLAAGGIVIGVLALEAGLRISEQLQDSRGNAPVDDQQTLQKPVLDARLGISLPANAAGHDANGFRNEYVPDQVDIVAIGDSQTWGQNAERLESWPNVLGDLSGQTVYNMGLGYFATVQYSVLLDDAVRFDPDVVVVGLYLGNDIWGTYQMVYAAPDIVGDRYIEYANPEYVDWLKVDTIAPRAERLFEERVRHTREFSETWLFRNSALVRALTQREFWPFYKPSWSFDAAESWAEANPADGLAYYGETNRTVFMPTYRLIALDLTDLRIQEGLRITRVIMGEMQEKANNAGIDLVFLIIPTKESVYAAAQDIYYTPAYINLLGMESMVLESILRFCGEEKIECVNALPQMQAAVLSGKRIYPEGADGHPIAEGYALLASIVWDFLKANQ